MVVEQCSAAAIQHFSAEVSSVADAPEPPSICVFYHPMNPHYDSKEEELRRREEALKEREIQIRMRELEHELGSPTVHPTTKLDNPPRKRRPWYKKLPDIGKFLLILIAVVVAVRIAAWLATAVLVLGVGWVGYKLFIEGDRP